MATVEDQKFCGDHQGRIAELFCIKCEIGVCTLCLCHGQGKHVGHVVTTIEDWCSCMKVRNARVNRITSRF